MYIKYVWIIITHTPKWLESGLARKKNQFYVHDFILIIKDAIDKKSVLLIVKLLGLCGT